MKIKLTKYVFAVLAITFALTSCSNNEDALATVQNSKQDILTFKNNEEFQSTLQQVIMLNDSELIEWENSKGFKSFGITCDEFYASIDLKEFKSLDDVKNYVSIHSDLLEIYQNETGDNFLEVQEFKNPSRYLMNTSRMYIIGDLVYKQYDDGIATTNIANISKLKNTKDINLLINDNLVTIFSNKNFNSKQKAANVVTNVSSADANANNSTGKRNIHVWIETSNYQHDNITERNVKITVRNYNWVWPIWVLQPSGTALNSTIVTSDYSSDPYKLKTYIESTDPATTYVSSLYREHNFFICGGYFMLYPYFTSYSVTAGNYQGCEVSMSYQL
ncbi:MAG: hypothetical protein ACYC25_00490 [Paludibacter sp.]